MIADPALVIVSEAEHPGSARVWGSGAWTPPAEREARDWFALCRLLGWGAQLGTATLGAIPAGVRWILVGADPPGRLVNAIDEHLEREQALAVMRAERGAERFEGRTLRWIGPGEPVEWVLEHPMQAVRLDGQGGDPWLTLDGRPAALAQRVGQGAVVTLGFHPSEARDYDPAVTAALRTLLTQGAGRTVAWFDMEGTLALRMDDPGGSQNVHLDPFAYRELDPDSWRELASLLRQRDGRLGVAAVAGWIDDGDTSRGELMVDGALADREPGRVHPSWSVTYRDRGGGFHDYAGEFAALRELAGEGLVDVAVHGYTHVHPDAGAWATASDRHTAELWYSEFALGERELPGVSRRLATGHRMLTNFFGVAPSVLVFPNDAWTDPVLESALELDLAMVASYYAALRAGDRWCWAEQLCAPYLDEPDARWFASGMPVVGYFHARDVALHGLAWVEEHLDAWVRAGASRLVSLGDLATALASRIVVEEGSDGPIPVVRTPPGRSLRGVEVRCLGRDGFGRGLYG